MKNVLFKLVVLCLGTALLSGCATMVGRDFSPQAYHAATSSREVQAEANGLTVDYIKRERDAVQSGQDAGQHTFGSETRVGFINQSNVRLSFLVRDPVLNQDWLFDVPPRHTETFPREGNSSDWLFRKEADYKVFVWRADGRGHGIEERTMHVHAKPQLPPPNSSTELLHGYFLVTRW